jgi:uncharacterized coiled-coil DUF342 family protein
MNEDFIFRLGADVSQFTKSISEVEAELKKVQNELKTKTGAAIVEANKYILQLQGSLEGLKKVGLDKLPQAAANGAASLNALGQVARDAPFGFIAIQNNLPILFDQLGNLSSKSGGAVNALKSIGSALIGPAGVTFAIGGAISAITVLVQKYGSFGGALDAIFSKQSQFNDQILEAAKSYEEFNKEKRTSIEIANEEAASVEGTISRVQSLGEIVADQTRSYNERNSALNDLKSISKEYFGNLDIEKSKLSDLTNAVTSYISSIKQAAITKGFEGAIGETSVELAKQIKLLDNLKGELEDAKRAPVKFIGKADQVDTRDIDAATERFNKQNQVVETLRKDISLYNAEITKSVQAQNALKAPIDASNKQFAEQKQRVKDATKLQKSASAQAEKDRQQNLRDTQDRIKRQDFLNKTDLKNLRRDVEERRAIERGAGIVTPTTLPTAPPQMPMNVDAMATQAQAATSALDYLKKEANMSAAFNLMNETFFSPVENLFTNFLQTGKFAFKEFAQSILKAISQIVGKIIATGVVTLLASLFIPGFGAAGGGIGKTLLSGITGALGFGGGGFGGASGARVAQPNFGGVSGGGMQMAGAVNLTLRGSDLVGSINRTNATINRVG